MCWTRRQWTDRGSKHFPRRQSTIEEVCELSLRDEPPVSIYVIPRERVELLELAATADHGPDAPTDLTIGVHYYTRPNGKLRYYAMDCGQIIGASNGEPTRFIRVEWNKSGAVHGYPLTESELMADVRKRAKEVHASIEGCPPSEDYEP